MKKTLLFVSISVLSFFTMETKAQLPDGSTAPNFTFTDLNGNTQDLYTYLNAGKSVVIDISATWCGPCWTYHTSGKLEGFYNQYGPPGTNEAMVIFIEGDNVTNDPCMTNTSGCNTSHGASQGNWVNGTPYPMCNPPAAQINTFNTDYQLQAFPQMYLICTDKKTKLVNQYSTAQLAAALATCPPPAPTQALDAGIPAILSPSGVACGSTFAPVVTLKNFGINALTSCTINYKIDNNANQTFNWTGNLASTAAINVTLPSISTTAGTHSFTCSTSGPNAGTDGNASNNQKVTTFTASSASAALPVVEGIENAAFPPSGWALTNADNSKTWARTTSAKKTGTASMWMDNYNYNANGQIDELITSPVDLAGATGATLTFQLAYRMYSDPSTYANSDSLKVLISTDCGVTWTKIYDKAHTSLITATPQFSSSQFTPTANDWRLETVSLAPYASSNNALIKFKHTTDYENSLFIDDINITGVVGINEVDLDSYVSAFPNPSTGNVFVNVNAMDLGQVNVKIYNVVGEAIIELKENLLFPKTFRFDLSEQPDGMYFIEVQSENAKTVKKIVLHK